MSQQQQNEINDLKRRVTELEQKLDAFINSVLLQSPDIAVRKTLSLKKQNG